MTQVERAFRLGVGEQLQKFRAMNIITRDTSRRTCRCIDKLASRCPVHLAGYRRTYFLDLVSKADSLEQTRGVGKDGNTRANLAQLASLFKDRYAQSARPQGEGGRQAADPAADDGDLKFLRHHLLLSERYSTL